VGVDMVYAVVRGDVSSCQSERFRGENFGVFIMKVMSDNQLTVTEISSENWESVK